MPIKKRVDYRAERLGRNYTTPRGGELVIVEYINADRVIVTCSLCSTNPLIEKSTFSTTFYRLEDSRCPCACANGYVYMEKDRTLIIYDKFSRVEGYSVDKNSIRKVGKRVLANITCHLHGKSEDSEIKSGASLNSELNFSMTCYTRLETMKRNTLENEEVLKRYPDTYKILMSLKDRVRILCTKCKSDKLGTLKICTGVFEGSRQRFVSGNLNCRCSFYDQNASDAERALNYKKLYPHTNKALINSYMSDKTRRFNMFCGDCGEVSRLEVLQTIVTNVVLSLVKTNSTSSSCPKGLR